MNQALEKLKFVPKFLVATNFLTMPSLNSKLFGALLLRNSFHSIFNIMKTKNSLTIVYIQLSSQNIARGCKLPCNQQFFAFATVPTRKKMIKRNRISENICILNLKGVEWVHCLFLFPLVLGKLQLSHAKSGLFCVVQITYFRKT